MKPWDAEQVRALAPDAVAAKAGEELSRAASWSASGSSQRALWGLCQGSGSKPYQTVVDLTGPAFRCSCPSRKFPCKHALGLLLLWSAGEIRSGTEPDWASAWLANREARAVAEPTAAGQGGVADPAAAQQRAARRAERVASGMAELESWLADQMRRGLSGFEKRGYAELSRLAARMVDAQAPGLAGAVRRAAGVVGRGHDWPAELLEELAIIHLTVSAHGRLDELPRPLVETVQTRIGWTVETARVLAEGEKVEDDWLVLGRVVEPDDRLTVRRVWLHGRSTGRIALVLSFAVAGRQLDPLPGRPGELVPGVVSFYPGALPLRALLTQSAPRLPGTRPDGLSAKQALTSYAGSLGRDPWNERWPLVLGEVRPARNGAAWALVDAAGDGLELVTAVDPWRLLSVSAGEPVTVAGEWTRAGFRPMTCWDGDRPVVLS
ncbi:MAG TPA: SWIM zinc finger family protein [Kribbella sp.]|nr:SWIM zinc finger family protein [Kribbella sp.]